MRICEAGHFTYSIRPTHIPNRIYLEASLQEACVAGKCAKLGESVHQWNGEKGHHKHHAHQAKHDFEVRVHAVAKEQVWILLDSLVRFRHFHVKLAAQGTLQPTLEASFITEATAAYIAQEGPHGAERGLLECSAILDSFNSIVDLLGSQAIVSRQLLFRAMLLYKWLQVLVLVLL